MKKSVYMYHAQDHKIVNEFSAALKIDLDITNGP